LKLGWTPSLRSASLTLAKPIGSPLTIQQLGYEESFNRGGATDRIVKSPLPIAAGRRAKERENFSMDKDADIGCYQLNANDGRAVPSFTSWGVKTNQKRSLSSRAEAALKMLFAGAGLALFLAGCGQDAPAPKSAADAQPAVPEEVQSAADALLGKETSVLLVGDLAKDGKQQFLAANVVPKTPKNNLLGTIITRAVVAENQDGRWVELLRCDEHLKNAKGYLPGTPLSGITGWRLAYEQDPDKGMALYFTPLKGTTESHSLPIGVRWNPETKRYQSLDRSYEHFLMESPSLQNARSSLR
jgi:hypothetical protein